jgi:hypothetical protein
VYANLRVKFYGDNSEEIEVASHGVVPASQEDWPEFVANDGEGPRYKAPAVTVLLDGQDGTGNYAVDAGSMVVSLEALISIEANF